MDGLGQYGYLEGFLKKNSGAGMANGMLPVSGFTESWSHWEGWAKVEKVVLATWSISLEVDMAEVWPASNCLLDL